MELCNSLLILQTTPHALINTLTIDPIVVYLLLGCIKVYTCDYVYLFEQLNHLNNSKNNNWFALRLQPG